MLGQGQQPPSYHSDDDGSPGVAVARSAARRSTAPAPAWWGERSASRDRAPGSRNLAKVGMVGAVMDRRHVFQGVDEFRRWPCRARAAVPAPRAPPPSASPGTSSSAASCRSQQTNRSASHRITP